MKVAKFGGSSLANAQQIDKVAQIVKNDPDIRVVVVSAPGKRHDEDIKVTDLLIALHTTHQAGIDETAAIQEIIDRYRSIVNDLHLDTALLKQFDKQLQDHLDNISDSKRLLDALKSCGENFNAMLISDYFSSIGLDSSYISPKEVGITVTDEPGNASLLDESYDKIAKLKGFEGILVVPGFFGYTKNGDIATFSRGGSDITGAIMTRGLDADIYENFTDQSFVYSAHPGIVEEAHGIKEITYREMRELSYSGFGIFHAEALMPLYETQTPIKIRNTNDPETDGTKIVYEREDVHEYPVIGVSGEGGFMTLTLKRYLLNREVGFLSRLFSAFSDQNVNIINAPMGIDEISIYFDGDEIDNDQHLNNLIEDLEKRFNPEWIHVEKNQAHVAVVGEGMKNTIGLAQKATSAFTDVGVSLSMINQGASEIGMFFSIDEGDLNKAIRSVHHAFFDDQK